MYSDLWALDRNSTEWTLVKGVTTENTRGSYGEVGVPSSEHYPGARNGAVCWVNPAEPDHLHLLAGHGYGATNETGNSTLLYFSICDT
jgi:hypothetical protein